MAEEQDQDDKTEDPTARRMEKAREDGQVLRSQDASTAVTLGVIATLYYGGFWFAPKLVELFKSALVLEPGLVFAADQSVVRFGSLFAESFFILTPLF